MRRFLGLQSLTISPQLPRIAHNYPSQAQNRGMKLLCPQATNPRPANPISRPKVHIPPTPPYPVGYNYGNKSFANINIMNELQNIHGYSSVNRTTRFCPVFCRESAISGQKRPFLPRKTTHSTKAKIREASPPEKPQSHQFPDIFLKSRIVAYLFLATSSTVTGSRNGICARSFLPTISTGCLASASRKARNSLRPEFWSARKRLAKLPS